MMLPWAHGVIICKPLAIYLSKDLIFIFNRDLKVLNMSFEYVRLPWPCRSHRTTGAGISCHIHGSASTPPES